MRDECISAIRAFNRSFTRQVGALSDSFLGTGRPLAVSRLLFEIGSGDPDGVPVAQLRDGLGLDSGYFSRLLRHLERDGLLELEREPSDGRRRIARLSEAGWRAWTDIDRRSDAAAIGITSALNPGQRRRLMDALATADRLFAVAGLTFEVVDPRSEAALWALGRYFAELDDRFVGGFDPGDTLVADAPALRAPGAFVLARVDAPGGSPAASVAACGGLVRMDRTTSEIKRMWVAPGWRGEGLGRRMLAELERLAADRGATRIVLDTNAVLDEAIAMYGRAGYRSIERYNTNPYAMHWFEKQLR